VYGQYASENQTLLDGFTRDNTADDSARVKPQLYIPINTIPKQDDYVNCDV
jgi:hypothetical protein